MIRMRYFSLVLIALTLLVFGNGLASADPTVSKVQVLSAIDAFQKDPASKDGFAAAATIMSFAKTSPLVHISLSKSVAPWLTDKDASDADTRTILLSAYVAGNVDAQLKSGKPVDDVYSGWEQVLTTYAQLLHINSAAKIQEVEELREKDEHGELRAYAAEVAGEK